MTALDRIDLGDAMACGNNHVSRDYLASPPTPSKASAAFLNKAAIETAIETLRLPSVEIDGRQVEGYQSKMDDKVRGKFDYFIGPDGQMTSEPGLHVHVFHLANGDVEMQITNRNDSNRSTTLKLSQPDGNEVHRAEQALAEIMRTL